jgi:5-methylcytosine-specific restriction protein A
MDWPFRTGIVYNRSSAVHAVFGGQQQGGISTPTAAAGIFLFTTLTNKAKGYADRRLADGSVRYTGEGQVGDMIMARGNRAIRDHATDGKDLLLFEKTKGGVRFLGLFICMGWDVERQLGFDGADREAIVFNLVPAEQATAAEAGEIEQLEAPTDLQALRLNAYQAAAQTAGTTQTRATVYQRSAAVRDYVLARAKGACESCGDPAPFSTVSGRPFLEAHHIRRVSDGGPDHPSFVAGVCPNCHRRAHFGADREQLNLQLLAKIDSLEAGT